MKFTRYMPIVAAFLLISQYAFAHGSEHHGKPVMGQVTSTEKDGFTIAGEKGDIKVSVSPDTKYTGANSQDTEMRPQAGDQLMVYGTKLESGKLAASEVMIHRQGATGTADGHEIDQGNRTMEGGHMGHN